MKCGETLVATQDPVADRETAEMEAGGAKNVEKRQEDRNARLASPVVRSADGGDVGRPLRGIARYYMARLRVTKKATINNVVCT